MNRTTCQSVSTKAPVIHCWNEKLGTVQSYRAVGRGYGPAQDLANDARALHD